MPRAEVGCVCSGGLCTARECCLRSGQLGSRWLRALCTQGLAQARHLRSRAKEGGGQCTGDLQARPGCGPDSWTASRGGAAGPIPEAGLTRHAGFLHPATL